MRILGSECPSTKAILISLQKVFGLNKTSVLKLCAIIGVNSRAKLNNISSSDLEVLKPFQSKLPSKIEYKKRRQSLIQLKHYAGLKQMFRKTKNKK
jgi:ribosomal protein S13